MVAHIRKLAVGRRQWLDDESFQAGVALCQTIPGATAMQMAAYVGLKLRGVAGAAASYVGFGLPAFLLMMALSAAYARAHSLPAVISALSGLQAVVVAVVAKATVSFGRTSLKNWKSVAIAVIVAGLFGLMANPVMIIALSALLGMVLNGRQAAAGRAADLGKIRPTTVPLLFFLFAAAAGFSLLFHFQKELFRLALNQSALTRWLTAFFLPHMVVPPNAFLKGVRVLGSVAFLSGVVVFVVCALQVYAGKLFRPGVAHRGLYALIRHPQYLALAVAAWGLAVMWPRFLTLTLFAIMLFLYYLLARDEERRMLNRFGESYRGYMERTGMFVPRVVECWLGQRNQRRPLTLAKAAAILLGLLVVCVGGGFLLRAYTVRHLPLAQVSGVDALTITTDDLASAKELLPSVLAEPAVASKLQAVQGGASHRVLAYFIPIDYIMQGMIADTGPEWKLFQHHRTFRMITEYILHPFAHVAGGHQHMAGMTHHDPSLHNSAMMKRRIIFLDVSAGQRSLASPEDDFGINVRRAPLFFVDVHLHTAEILQVRDLAPGSGWGRVPTPMF